MITTEELYLKFPTLEDEQAVMEFRDEYLKSGTHFAGSADLEIYDNYGDWLKKITDDLSKETLPEGRVASTQFLTIRKADNKIVGLVQVRHELNDYLFNFSGHIGDCIRPSERNKGYATEQIRLALEFCKTLNIKKVLITCKKENIASARTIEKNGGVFENEATKETGEILKRYWITL